MSVANERGILPPDKIQEAYTSDVSFREYVHNYCRNRGIEITEALAHITVNEVAKYYKDSAKGIISNGRTEH